MSSLELEFGVITAYVFGGCAEKCGLETCNMCDAHMQLKFRAMRQPMESKIIVPTYLFSRYTSNMPQPFFIIVMFYTAVSDFIQRYCNPREEIEFKDERWHRDNFAKRNVAYGMLCKMRPEMQAIVSEMLDSASSMRDVLRAYEHCVFTGMAILEACGRGTMSSSRLEKRIRLNVQKKMSEEGTMNVLECDIPLCGNAVFERAIVVNDEWNEVRRGVDWGQESKEMAVKVQESKV